MKKTLLAILLLCCSAVLAERTRSIPEYIEDKLTNAFVAPVVLAGFAVPAPSLSTNVAQWDRANYFSGLTNSTSHGLHAGDQVSLLAGSTDIRGTFVVATCSGVAVDASSPLATITWGTNYSKPPTVVPNIIVFSNTASHNGNFVEVSDVTTSNALISSGPTAMGADAAVWVNYILIQ